MRGIEFAVFCLCVLFAAVFAVTAAAYPRAPFPHDEIDGPARYESFRDGFIPGARLMMEAARGQSGVNDDG